MIQLIWSNRVFCLPKEHKYSAIIQVAVADRLLLIEEIFGSNPISIYFIHPSVSKL